LPERAIPAAGPIVPIMMKKPFDIASILLAASIAAVSAGCRVPRVAVRQTMPMVDTMHVAGHVVKHYRPHDYLTLDSTERILRYEYLPIDLFAVTDASDSVTTLFCSAWQVYLWRFSEHLDPTDKQYYVPSPISIGRAEDSLTVTWGYPQIDDRDEDLKDIVKRRNEYWSVERMAPGVESVELWYGPIRSFPQYTTFDQLSRFAPGGSFVRAMADSANALRIARSQVIKFLTPDERNSTGG
jgi:hypothetical protein